MLCAAGSAGSAGSAGVGCFMVLWYSSLQREFPEQVQGRDFALEGLAGFGLQPLALAVTPLPVRFIGVAPFATLAVVVLLVSTYGALAVPGTARPITRARTCGTGWPSEFPPEPWTPPRPEQAKAPGHGE
ncbi:hypothetical protein GCM10010433_40280 [Streptomyces pulveraceus]